MKGFPAGILDTTGWTGGVGVHVEFDFGAPSVIQLPARGRGFLSRRKCDGAIRSSRLAGELEISRREVSWT